MLSYRLKELASMVESRGRVIDVGCDHGLLDIYLAKLNPNLKIIATDISAKALNNCQRNVQKSGLENQITPVLTDGLEKVQINQDDFIIISGMGTNTIKKILKDKLEKINNILIQTNHNHEELRKFMINQGFKIKQEKVIFDGRYYIFIHFTKGKIKYVEEDFWLGPFIKNSNNITYFKYVLKKYQKILTTLPNNDAKMICYQKRFQFLQSLIERKSDHLDKLA